MPDYSKDYFSEKRKEPARLPKRFKNAQGESFYSFNCTLTQILGAGYYGPVQKPVTDEHQKLVWDPQDVRYNVVDKTPEDLAKEEDKKVREEIKARLENVIALDDVTLTEEYKEASTSQYGKLYSLQAQSRLLVWGDIPVFASGIFAYQAQENICEQAYAQQAYTHLDSFRYGYEYMGSSLPELRKNHEFDAYCVTYGEPTSWVPSGDSADQLAAWEAYAAADGFVSEEVTFNG